jgi:hypothetical protein
MPENSLSDRVDDIEKTIGDLNQVLEALKNCLTNAAFQPTCPPYCAHDFEPEYVNESSLADQVGDIGKTIGDLAALFECLRNVLVDRVQPTCPPYCAHESQGNMNQADMKKKF